MKIEVVDSSPVAQVAVSGKIDLPLSSLSVGKSLKITDCQFAEPALRTYVSRNAKKLDITCKVIKHADCYEVARIK